MLSTTSTTLKFNYVWSLQNEVKFHREDRFLSNQVDFILGMPGENSTQKKNPELKAESKNVVAGEATGALC